MKIDITIYDDNDNMIMAYYSEQADLDSLRDCALTLCKLVISDQNETNEKKEKKSHNLKKDKK